MLDRWVAQGEGTPRKSAPSRPKRRKRIRPGESGPSHERWLVSYADFITLMFAVFTVMYALSAVDKGRYAKIAASLQAAFRAAPPGRVGVGSEGLVVRPKDAKVGFVPPAGKDAVLEQMRARIESRLLPVIESRLVSIETDQRGLVLSLREAGAFAPASADLSESAGLILGEIGASLATIDNHVRIEGHTDNVPIHTDRFSSNWELSTARATTVVRFMLDRAGIAPSRLSAAGYAEFFPRVPNDSEPGRAFNRRVDIVVLSPQTQASQEPPDAKAAKPPESR